MPLPKEQVCTTDDIYCLPDGVRAELSVICDPEKLTDEGCVGAPDWIIEIDFSQLTHGIINVNEENHAHGKD